jgi:hypothetical protein
MDLYLGSKEGKLTSVLVSPGPLGTLIICCSCEWDGAAETAIDCTSSTNLETELLAYRANEDHEDTSHKKH